MAKKKTDEEEVKKDVQSKEPAHDAGDATENVAFDIEKVLDEHSSEVVEALRARYPDLFRIDQEEHAEDLATIPDEIRKHFVKVQGGRMHLTVVGRILWLRKVMPKAGIETCLLEHDPDKGFAMFHASVFEYDENGQKRILGEGTKTETKSGFKDYVEKAETGAVGRALAICGFGTSQAQDELETGIIDTPQPPRPVQQKPAPPRPATLNAEQASRITSRRIEAGIPDAAWAKKLNEWFGQSTLTKIPAMTENGPTEQFLLGRIDESLRKRSAKAVEPEAVAA